MERYVKFKSGNIELAGTLAIPEDFKGKLPAFVLVCGSGPNDRDYNPDPKFIPSEIKELLNKLKIRARYVTSLIFPNIDHLLRFEPQESGEFRYAQTLDREVEPIILKSISSWAKQLFFC